MNEIYATPLDDEERASANSRQYIGFHIGQYAFAAPIDALQEIIRVPALSTVPLSPPSLRGLANLRGTVLPVLNLRNLFDMPGHSEGEAARILVMMLGKPVGFMADTVTGIFSIEAEQLDLNITDAKVDKTLLSGLIRHAGKVMMLIDFSKILQREFSTDAARVSGRLQMPDSDSDGDNTLADVRLVSFVVDEQEYAFHIEQVEEIIFLPEKITQVPNAHASVAGVISSHDILLPVFYLRPMLSLPKYEPTAQNRVIVISLQISGKKMAVGLIVDTVTEVLHVHRDTLDKVPALLGRDSVNAEIAAICRLDNGRRLISILSPEALFGAEMVQSLIESLQETTIVSDEDDSAGIVTGEKQLVVFRLLDEEFGLSIEHVQEIVRVPDLASVPKAPDFIAGVFNLRGTVLPVVNQRRRFGFPDAADIDSRRIMVLDVKGIRTGFIVDSITEVLRVSDKVFEATPDFFQPRIRMVQQVAHLSDTRMVLMLDIEQLLDSVELKALSKVSSKMPKPK